MLRQGRHRDALPVLERAVDLAPDEGEVVMLYGVALAQVGRASQATDALRRATMLMPDNARAFANLAVHLYDQGLPEEARQMADEALRIDPEDASAKDVLARAGSPVAPGAAFEVGETAVPANAQAVKDTYEATRIHGLSFLRGRDRFWTGIGIALLVGGLATTILLRLAPPFTPPTPGAKDPLASMVPKQDPTSAFVFLIWITSGLGAMSWVLFDIIDRRARLHWIIPQVICCFCGLPWIPLGLYMGMGRK